MKTTKTFQDVGFKTTVLIGATTFLNITYLYNVKNEYIRHRKENLNINYIDDVSNHI